MNNRIIELAFAFAESQEQAHFLNEMGRSLRQGIKKNWNCEMQFCRIADHINDDGKFLVESLTRFLEEKLK